MSLDEEVIPFSNEEIPVYPVWKNGNFFKILIKPDVTMLEPDDYATKDKPGWLNGKLEDKPDC